MIDDAMRLFQIVEKKKNLKSEDFIHLLPFKTTDIADKVFSNKTWPSDWLSVCKFFMYLVT